MELGVWFVCVCVCVPQRLSPVMALASGHYTHSESLRRWELVLWLHLHHGPLNASVLRETSVPKQQCTQLLHQTSNKSIKVWLPSRRSFLRTRSLSIFPSKAPSSAERNTKFVPNRPQTLYLCTGRIQFGVNTNGYRCSRPPEWSLWPSEEGFSSGRWTDRQTERQTGGNEGKGIIN